MSERAPRVPGLSPILRPAVPPFVPPTVEDPQLQAVLGNVAQAINRKADMVSVPTFASIHLIAPDGSTWMLRVDATGAVVAEQMP